MALDGREKESRSQPDQQGSAVQDKVKIKSKQQSKSRKKTSTGFTSD